MYPRQARAPQGIGGHASPGLPRPPALYRAGRSYVTRPCLGGGPGPRGDRERPGPKRLCSEIAALSRRAELCAGGPANYKLEKRAQIRGAAPGPKHVRHHDLGGRARHLPFVAPIPARCFRHPAHVPCAGRGSKRDRWAEAGRGAAPADLKPPCQKLSPITRTSLILGTI